MGLWKRKRLHANEQKRMSICSQWFPLLFGKKRRHTVLLIDETDVKTTTWYGLRMRKAKRKELHAYKHKMRNNGGLVVLNVSETIAGWDEKAKKTAISRHPP